MTFYNKYFWMKTHIVACISFFGLPFFKSITNAQALKNKFIFSFIKFYLTNLLT